MPRKKSFPAKKIFLPALAVSILFNLYFLVNKYLPSISTEEKTFSSNVVRIIDGDTFDLANDQRIRLAGANTPEFPKECLAQEAKDRLEELLLGKKVTLEPMEEDKFSRLVSYVFADQILIDQIMVEEGLAKALAKNPLYDPQILSAQEKAEKLEKGIWSQKCQPKKDCLIKANTTPRTESKFYHLPGCYNYAKVVIKENEGDYWFCTEEEAEAAGFTKSQDCPEESGTSPKG